MTANERLLVLVLQDAIEMLRWQSRKSISAESWAEWAGNAIEAIDVTVRTDYMPREMVEGDL